MTPVYRELEWDSQTILNFYTNRKRTVDWGERYKLPDHFVPKEWYPGIQQTGGWLGVEAAPILWSAEISPPKARIELRFRGFATSYHMV